MYITLTSKKPQVTTLSEMRLTNLSKFCLSLDIEEIHECQEIAILMKSKRQVKASNNTYHENFHLCPLFYKLFIPIKGHSPCIAHCTIETNNKFFFSQKKGHRSSKVTCLVTLEILS